MLHDFFWQLAGDALHGKYDDVAVRILKLSSLQGERASIIRTPTKWTWKPRNCLGYGEK